MEPADAADVLPLAAALRALPGVAEVVPAARTLLVCCDAGTAPFTLRAAIDRAIDQVVRAGTDPAGVGGRRAAGTATPASAGEPLVLDVRYDGPDLDDVAAATGLSVEAVVRLHAGADYVVAFTGFAPGFGYLRGLPAELHTGRLAQPRPAVPAGSVGIAGDFTGVYPRRSPGGWRLLGHTDAVLWDADRPAPALLVPGRAVRFRPVRP